MTKDNEEKQSPSPVSAVEDQLPIIPKLKEEKKVENSSVEELNEVSLSWAGKLFFAGIASYLAGVGLEKLGQGKSPPKLPFKIRGTPQQIQAVTSAIVSSKDFQKEIDKPGATVETVIQKLNLKNMNKQKFEQMTGKKWPL